MVKVLYGVRAKERGKPVVKKEWSEFYAEPAGVSGFLENIIVHREFLEEIVRSGPRDVLEVGCGSGTLSVFLSHLGCRVTAVDKDERIIKKAKQASDTLNGRVSFRICDAFSLPFGDKTFDVSFSQGVLEHFSDEDIVRILKEQVRVAGTVFFSVPGVFYNHRDFGDERLLTRKQWERILSGFDVRLSGYYYRISARRNLMIKLPIMYMAEIR